MTLKLIGLAGVTASLFVAPALAHHSFAMFDQAKTVELEGTVKEFQWTNPHSWLIVDVADDTGKVAEWGLEMGSPGGLARRGWRPKTLVPGDNVTFKAHPLRTDEPGGQFVDVKLPDGTVLTD